MSKELDLLADAIRNAMKTSSRSEIEKIIHTVMAEQIDQKRASLPCVWCESDIPIETPVAKTFYISECAVCNKSMLVYVGTVRTVNQKFVGMFSIVKLVVIRCYDVDGSERSLQMHCYANNYGAPPFELKSKDRFALAIPITEGDKSIENISYTNITIRKSKMLRSETDKCALIKEITRDNI
jgi:hypothetical protein